MRLLSRLNGYLNKNIVESATVFSGAVSACMEFINFLISAYKERIFK